MRNKLALGTVQFGLNYGIKNCDGQVPVNDVQRILQLAREENVSIIDTAQAYGNSEEILGNASMNGFSVVTKFVAPSAAPSLADTIVTSLKRLNLPTIYGVLFHHFNDWEVQPQLWTDLQTLKREGFIEKIGFSLYHPEEWLLLKKKKIVPDILQLPMNLLNQQFTSHLSEFKQAGIEIHIRSAFLQGLLLMGIDQIPRQFSEITPKLKALKKLSESLNINPATTCLHWLWQNPQIDYIVIGVDSFEQWEHNICSAKWCEKNKDKIEIDASDFMCANDRIINPANWKR